MLKPTDLSDTLKGKNKDHTVKIRAKKLNDGSYSLFLDHYIKGSGNKRDLTYLNLRLTGNKVNDKEALLSAELQRNQIEADINEYGTSRSHNKRKADFIEYFTHLAKSKSRNWESCVIKFKAFHRGSLPFNKIDMRLIEDFRDSLLNDPELQRNSAWNYLSVLKTALNKAVKEEYLHTSPARWVTIKPEETERPFLTKDQLKQLHNTYCKLPEVKNAFLFSCYSGLRISDIIALTWNNITEDTLSIRQKKTSSLLSIPVMPGAKEILALYTRTADKKIFTLPCHKHINEVLKAWIKSAGIDKDITFHCARHTFAILGLEADIPINVLQKLLGHSLLATTLIYAKVQDSSLIKAAEKFGKYLGGE